MIEKRIALLSHPCLEFRRPYRGGCLLKIEELGDLLTFRKQRSLDAESVMRYELWEEAEKINRDIIKNIPNDIAACQRLGDVLSRVGRVDESVIYYQKRSKIEKLKREQTKAAVDLAIKGLWQEAADLNQVFVRDYPWDMEGYNRLGKSLMELGRNRQAKEAFNCTLVISPSSSIAKKNLIRLGKVKAQGKGSKTTAGASSKLFIEETGKTVVTSLVNLTNLDDIPQLGSGQSVVLTSKGKGLVVCVEDGVEIGGLEAKLASRLHRLIDGGNQYEANIVSVTSADVAVIIRETFRDPSQIKTPSFSQQSSSLPSISTGTLGYALNDSGEKQRLKDWSNDDTESGDDDVFSPLVPKILSGNSGFDSVDY